MPSLLYALSAVVLAASTTEAFVSSPRALLPSYAGSTGTGKNTHACRNAGSSSSLSMHGGHHLSAERKAELVATATAMSQSGKGLTACDEGPGTIGDRFEKVGIENTEENRRLYRQMLFTVANGDQFLSGAILDPETVYQKTDDGVLFPELLTSRGIVPGVKPHLKVYELPGCKPGETVMQGLDSLAVRCKEYYAAGCRFAKWRSPLVIGADGDISALAIQTNMDDLARWVRSSECYHPFPEHVLWSIQPTLLNDVHVHCCGLKMLLLLLQCRSRAILCRPLNCLEVGFPSLLQHVESSLFLKRFPLTTPAGVSTGRRSQQSVMKT